MRHQIDLDESAFLASERPVSYELGNALLESMLALQRIYRLRPEQMQVFLLIMLATVQKFLRDGEPDPDLRGRAPLPAHRRGGISRRRIADVLDIPYETVRRHVAELVERGLVAETERGCLATTGGTLAFLGDAGVPITIARKFARATNVMLRHGAAKARSLP